MNAINYWTERDLIPFKSKYLIASKVLVIAPHPDDETLGCGGSLIQHIERGEMVKVLFLTDGSGGDFLNKHDPNSYVAMREEEAIEACSILGIQDYKFMRIKDRALGSSLSHIQEIKEEIRLFDPSMIYVTSPLELNPDHRSAADLIWQAINELRCSVKLAFYEVSTPLQPNVLVDISQHEKQKRLAASCYASQMNPIDYSDLALSVNRFRSLTIASTASYAEAYFVMDSINVIGRKLKDFFTLKKLTNVLNQKEDVLVSVVVRTKNRPELLYEALSSIRSQTYQNIEVIIVNDGGIDVQNVIDQFQAGLQIKYIQYSQSKGRSSAANIGLSEASGSLLGFLDDDDIFYHDHISTLVEQIELEPSIELVYSDCDLMRYEEGATEFLDSNVVNAQSYKGVNFDRDQLYQMNYIPIMTALFTRSVLERSGYMDESLDVFEDWDLWIRMSLHSDFKRVPIVTCNYRIIEERDYNYLDGQTKIYEKYWQIYTPKNVIRWLHQSQGQNDLLRSEVKRLKGEA